MRYVTQRPRRGLRPRLLAALCLLGGAIAPALAQNVADSSVTMAAPVVFESGLHTLAVAWTAAAEADPPVTDYDIQYRATGSANWMDGPQDLAVTHARIGNLLKDTNYQVRVRANRNGDEGAWSQPGEGATALWTAGLTVGAANRQPRNYWGYERRGGVFGHLNPTVFSYGGVEYDIFILSWYRG
ncbi:MAG: fibronectin type III domain-containing protein, partial [Gemmatimonadetes bacterium]|nr:fibronectin type III domain-containing protein [Gemmatimonadota bacterium]